MPHKAKVTLIFQGDVSEFPMLSSYQRTCMEEPLAHYNTFQADNDNIVTPPLNAVYYTVHVGQSRLVCLSFCADVYSQVDLYKFVRPAVVI